MKIFVADQQSHVRYALSVLLQNNRDYELTETANDAEELIAKIKKQAPDILLLDWNLPGMMLSRLIFEVRRIANNIHIIVMSTFPEVHEEAQPLDIDFFISKVDPPDRLMEILAQCKERSTQHPD